MSEPLTIDELIKYEKEYGNIYLTEIGDIAFYWREITQNEMEQVTRLFEDEEERAEYICWKCVLKPADFDFSNCYAGITDTLNESILLQSGLQEGYGKEMLKVCRQAMNDFENQIVPIICAAFPAIHPEEIEKWTINKQIRYLAMAEWAMNVLHGIPLEIGSEQKQVIDYDAFPELRGRK